MNSRGAVMVWFTCIIPFFVYSQTQVKSMEDIRYPFAVKKIDLPNQVSIAYADEGKGKTTLIFIHGLGSYLPAWKKVVDELRQDYRCIVVDLPGYGKSGRGDWSYDMAFFADCIEALVKKLKLRKVSLVGHSMGGQISLTLALRQPQWLQKLVLLAPAGFETFTEADRAWFTQYVTPAVFKATPVAQIERNFDVNFYGAKMPADARFMYEDRLLMRETAEFDQYCNMIPKCVQGMLQQPVADRLHEIKTPTLVFYGNDDLLIPNRILHPKLSVEAVAKQGQEQLPQSQLVMVPKCGHFVLWDGAATVCASIKTFLNTLQ